MGETFGQWLKRCRTDLGMSLRDVERATEGAVSNATLSQLESGKIERPNIVIVAALSAVYALPSGEVFDRALAGNKYSPPPVCSSCGQVLRTAPLASCEGANATLAPPQVEREGSRDALIQSLQAEITGLREALAEVIEHYINSAHAHSREGYCEGVEEFANVKRWRQALASVSSTGER